ncbi:DUF2794 domain-containing protein [Parasphingorhabdus sp.]|uniref:DUF2794 domain-containing protein n=1 Tax=Parasphingorhabdus sp. TaxID=2709688 RepID=UPI003263F859
MKRSAESNVAVFPQKNLPSQVGFERRELERILNLYGRMVSAGHWKDYAMDMRQDVAIFAAFRRASERPQIRIEKRPADRNRQGMWSLHGEQGQILKRGHDLAGVLAPVERKLLKLVVE